jgi:hypothetical protein
MASTPPQPPKSSRLNAAVRNSCWIRYNGIEGIAKCYCCGLEQVTRSNFDAGHVISRAKGGKDDLSNLRPICGMCNSSAGAENMRDFVRNNGLMGRMKDEPIEVITTHATVSPIPTGPAVESKSSKTACQTCKKLFTPATLAKYDGKNCNKCFLVLTMAPPQKIRLEKAPSNDIVSPVCAHCGQRNVVIAESA